MPPSRLWRARRLWASYLRRLRGSRGLFIFLLLSLLSAMALMLALQEKKDKTPRVYCVTGAGGFLGFHLIQELSGYVPVAGVDVITKDSIQRARLDLLNKAGIRVYNVDVTDQQALASLFVLLKVGVVIDFTQHEKYGSELYNGKLMVSLLMAGMQVRVKKMFFASPNRFYIPSSRSGEKVLSSYQRILPFSVTEFRFSTVYGEYGRRDMPYYSFTGKLLDNKTIFLLVGTKGLQDYVDVRSAVTALRGVVLTGEFQPIWDICSATGPVSNMKIISLLSNFTGVAPTILEVEGAGDPPYETPYVKPAFPLVVDALPIGQGLQEFVKWYRAEGFNYKKIPKVL